MSEQTISFIVLMVFLATIAITGMLLSPSDPDLNTIIKTKSFCFKDKCYRVEEIK